MYNVESSITYISTTYIGINLVSSCILSLLVPHEWASALNILVGALTPSICQLVVKYWNQVVVSNTSDRVPAQSKLFYGFCLGLLSTIPTLIILLPIHNIFNKIVIEVLIGPVIEELVKFWFVCYLFKSNAVNNLQDGFVYGALVGAGFAIAENIMYELGGVTNGIFLMVCRSIIGIVGHPLYTGLAGMGVAKWKVGIASSKYNNIWKSILLHCLWNLAASADVALGKYCMIAVMVLKIIIINIEFYRVMKFNTSSQ